ncbi:PROBABLE CONSERVED MEMBRANE PROTEIN [Alloactinosynnema sp. L-07]|uniref:DUF4307 domain-containing protein n=1 Tax=Alloactinosynnema sp. L-07 TaxID=1653480 RepID=UPI00065EF12B|nr:DUF4307 domain-containing protein [Alloactinosynnema sp. L-07]CRK61581.1 PROBABLE CONSERVED MEMBRANE PROTEIN [Alloactinosynnema sp. L-07]
MTVAGRALPEGRYGKPPARRSRRATTLMIAAGLAVGGVVAYLAYQNLGTAPIEAERTSFSNLPGNQMQLVFDVTRETPDRAAVCIVRTRSLDGGEGGRKEVYIAPGPDRVRVTTVIVSSTEPVTADIFGCSYQVPEYLSTTQPPTG